MKKYLITLLIALMLLPILSPLKVAKATPTEYLRVITNDTPFYTDERATDPLFYLPYTYYVKVLDKNSELCHVEVYGTGNTVALDGFVPTDMLFNDGLSVTNPFAMQTLTTSQSAVLYQDSTLSTPLQYVFAERSMRYYGSLSTDDGIIYYVGYNNRLGYVKESDVYPFALADHPNKLTFIKEPETVSPTPPTDEQPETEQAQEFFSLKIVVIVCLILAGILALVFSLRTRPQKSVAVGYYDENDYE